jgi:hybrid cluster-associated redox disulfide protein
MFTSDMKVIEVLQANPDTAAVFTGYGMGCIHCLLAHGESVAEAAAAHGIDLDEMLSRLNAVNN